MTGANGIRKVYIEVKTTASTQKTYYPISIHQVKVVLEKQEDFHLYRVFGAGNTERAKLTNITNLAQRLDTKQIGLMIYL